MSIQSLILTKTEANNLTNQKACKECGELFTPKGRESYCSKLHYRPCPVCGTPVEAKYLSDPPRCCSKECQKQSRAAKSAAKPAAVATATKPVVATSDSTTHSISPANVEVTTDTTNIGDCPIKRYAGPDNIMNWHTGHVYQLEITKRPNQPYMIFATFDHTDNKSVDLALPLSSQISIQRYFESVRKEV